MQIKPYFTYAVIILLLWSGVCAARPYWDKYWLEQEMKTAALHGTKTGVEAAAKFLDAKMEEQGRGFTGDDFEIERNADNSVKISITYADEIRVFGLSLKKLRFTVETNTSDVEARF